MRLAPNFSGVFAAGVAVAIVTALECHADTDAQHQQEARQLVRQFAGELKPRLQGAMQNGGPAHAIAVCAEEAPRIADTLSANSGWQIKRVSLKPRNIQLARPDDWERARLVEFERQLAAGTAIADMSASQNDGEQFRYMQPQAVEGVCLACHGEKLSAEVSTALQQFAPGDTATGYRLGQIRGAFSLKKVLP